MANKELENELQAADAFSQQSVLFDTLYSNNTIIKYKRERVRHHVNQYLPAHSKILELNAGTGEDSIYFAMQGHKVHATDISIGMLNVLREKVKKSSLSNAISVEQCSFNHLDKLESRGPYNLIFSNFAGLNCTANLADIIASFDSLLTPAGLVTLVVMPPFCIWELALALRGNLKAALRRFNSRNGVTAYVEGIPFKCWYYTPSEIEKIVAEKYTVLSIEGLCTIVPPSYFEHFAEKHPKTYQYLRSLEHRNKSKWPWRNIGDYFIITFQRKQPAE